MEDWKIPATWTKEEVDHFFEIQDSKSLGELCEIFNKSYKSVTYLLRCNGIEKRNIFKRPYHVQKSIYNYAMEHSPLEASKRYKLSINVIRNIIARIKVTNKKNIESLRNEILEKTRLESFKFGRRKGLSVEDAEDFAIHSVIKHIEGGFERMKLTYVLINWREEKENARKGKSSEYNDAISYVDGDLKVSSNRTTFDCALNPLEEKERIIVCLNIIFNLSQKEIGYVLNVTESRVSQLYKSALEKIQRRRNIIDELREGMGT